MRFITDVVKMRLIWTYISIAILVIANSASAQGTNNLVTMPNLIGMTQDTANETLLNLGLVPLFQFKYNDEFGMDEVFNQEIQPEKKISPGKEVNISISLGPYPVHIENPKKDELANSMIIVTGDVTSSFSRENKLWIVVNPLNSSKNYWPQSGGPLIVDPNEQTFKGAAFLGGNKNDSFLIAVLVVNKTLSDAFSKWVSVCSARNSWPPITEQGADYDMVSKEVIDNHIGDSVWVKLNE